MKYIHKTNGQYLGFIQKQHLFLWNGDYLASIDNQGFIWDKDGNFAGKLMTKNNVNYAVRNTMQLTPVSKSPKPLPPRPSAPIPQPSVPPIQLSIDLEDIF